MTTSVTIIRKPSQLAGWLGFFLDFIQSLNASILHGLNACLHLLRPIEHTDNGGN
jgi:hypothetical protein